MSPHPSTEHWDPAGEEVRRAVLGDAHVDRARRTRTPSRPTSRTSSPATPGAGSGPGPGSTAGAQLITLAMLAVMRQERVGDARQGCARNGLTRDEIKEVLLQVGVYAGVPVANQAFRIAQQVLAEEEPDG